MEKYIYDEKNGLLLSGELLPHLIEIDQQAQEMYDQLMHQMAVRAGISEELKTSDQLAWVGVMNNIRNTAEEVVFNE